jgi:hypothetical protein
MNFSPIIDFVKDVIRTNPTRLVAYAVAGTTAVVVWAANRMGVVIPDAVIASLGVMVTFLTTELIRKLVYSPASVEVIAANSASSGVATVPAPPATDVVENIT